MQSNINAHPIDHQQEGNRLLAQPARLPNGLHTFVLPAGTIAWSFSAHTYGGNDNAAHAALRFDAPPADVLGEPLVFDSTKALASLRAGETLHYLCPSLGPGMGNAGGFSFVTAQLGTMPAPLPEARTVYLLVAAPGGLLDLVSQIDVAPGYVPAPAPQPGPAVDPALDQRAAGYVLKEVNQQTLDGLKGNPEVWPLLAAVIGHAERGGADLARKGLL